MKRKLIVAMSISLIACAHSQPGGVMPAGFVATAVAQVPVRAPAGEETIARLIHEGMQNSHVDADLMYLLDVIGPRLSGSPEMRRANEWTQQKFREYGADRTDLESYKFGVTWTRGPTTARMLAPQHRELLAVSWAWSRGTNGPLAGDVVYVDARTPQEYQRRFAGRLSGKWVMIGAAYPNANPDGPPMTAADSARLDSLRRARLPQTDEERRFMPARYEMMGDEKVAGVIWDGGKEFGLLTMSGAPDAIAPFPQIVISNENYSQFQRLIQRGERVSIEVDIKNTFGRDEVDQANTVAEIRGTEKPDEVVLLGAHLDSWDLATGGTDNGTGAIAVLEAARILKAADAKPKRTIRFVLFSGEEEGLFGSQAYVKAHRKELDNIQAVLVLDNGTGRITGMALQGHDDLRDLWKSMMSPLNDLGPLAVRSGNKTGTDHLSFIPFGVPAFNYDQLTRGYNHTHHSQVDDYNHVVPSDVAQAATIMAVNAWQLANLPQLLPRGKKE